MKNLLLLAVLLVPGLAGAAGSSVYDAGSVAIPKADYQVNPNIPANEKIVAADWNQLGQYMLDASTAIRWGYYHGLAPQTAIPGAPDSGMRLFVYQPDGGALSSGLWAEFPDAGLQQVFDGNQQMDHLWVRGDVGIDGGLVVNGTGVSNFEWTAPNIVAASDMASAGTLEVSGKATLGSLYVTGTAGLDAGLTVNNGAISLNSFASEIKAKFTGAATVGRIGFHIDTTNAFDGTNTPFEVDSAGVELTGVDGTGLVYAKNGVNFNSQKGQLLLSGTSNSDAVNLGQLKGITSMAAYAPSAIAAGTALGAKAALGAGTARTLNATKQINGTCAGDPCGGSSTSWATYEVKDTTSGISICSVAVPSCCFASVSSPCAAFFANAPVTTCVGTYALSDNLQIDVTDAGAACNALPTAMVNFGGY